MKRLENSWFLCTVAREGKHNWEICKKNSIWGVPSNGRKLGITVPRRNDYLIIYQAGRGISAFCVVNETPRIPKNKEEAPWAGGIYKYGLIIPFKLECEIEESIPLKFEKGRPINLEFSLNIMRKGFGLLSNTDGEKLAKLANFKY